MIISEGVQYFLLIIINNILVLIHWYQDFPTVNNIGLAR